MKRHTDRPVEETFVYTALEEFCPDCQRVLPIYQVISRPVECVDRAVLLKRRDKRCGPDCPGERPVFFAPRDLRVVLPNRIYGLDVTLHVGERHLRDGVALAQITRDLNARGLPIDQRHTGRVFRDFVALTTLLRGNEAAVQARLRAQGGMVLMCDGVQFDNRSPVLYLTWDAISGTPLFGERKPFRGADDIVPLLERVRDMGVPVLGVVTDKEKGLVPAVERVFPEVPHQLCHTHFLKNCAKPLQADLTSLQASVRRRADAARKLSKQLQPPPAVAPEASASEERVVLAADETQVPAPSAEVSAAAPAAQGETQVPASGPAPLTEEALTRELCELVRVNSRVSGKAPLDPAELKRHERIESIRALLDDARKKKPWSPMGTARGPCSTR
jgi:Transposase, Mutator family